MNKREKLRKNRSAYLPAVTMRMGIAVLIADAMKEKNISKSELARRLKKSPAQVTRWLSGTVNFRINTLAEIFNVLDINLFPIQPTNNNHPYRSVIVVETKQYMKVPVFEMLENNECVIWSER